MREDVHQKVTASHLKRQAYLYVRQSTLRQVLENTESTDRQYALRQRAVALGWATEQIVVIDSDLGQSGASAADREGFQRLVAEVGMGRAGIVMGLEVSRLARNSTDWHRLLEICALSETLILDEDGVYDPGHFNDRLLLGLKGTMSEAELHLLRARMRGGILNKARRGELECPLPIGFVYGPGGRVELEPDKQIQDAIRLLFETFRRTGSATATVKAFRAQGLRFPRRAKQGPTKGELFWAELQTSRVLHLLHNPRYAGAFFFGRTRQRKHAQGQRYTKLPRDQWHALVRDAHVGYISWEEHEENQLRLAENSKAQGKDREKSPPREGPALLQGLAICGKCGKRMGVHYNKRPTGLLPTYLCQREKIEKGGQLCQSIHGEALDRAIGALLVETVNPVAIDVALAVQEELRTQVDEADRHRRMHVERARYEADLARRRFMRVDPDNRLVADSLEAEWNEKLRGLAAAQEEYERRRREDQLELDDERRARILRLASDFPRLWQDPQTPARERKRMIHLLVEDVTLHKTDAVTAHVRFRGGATRTLTLALPKRSWELRVTSPEVVAEIDALLDHHTSGQIATILNAKGLTSKQGLAFHAVTVARLRHQYGLKTRYDRVRGRGLLTTEEIAEQLGVSTVTVNVWRRMGLLRATACDDRDRFLYEPPGEDRPIKGTWKTQRLAASGQS